jgi:thiosulfate/3-mercaptopyruvate sulfurtransferase
MKRITAILAVLALLAVLAGCGPAAAGESDTEIISAAEALELLAAGGNVVLVDARNAVEYRESHVEGAVNISRADIVVMTPHPNLVAPAERIEDVMGSRGIDNDTLVIAYDDNNNMDSARLWWTLKAYGHDAVKVVSGGLSALQGENVTMSSTMPQVTEAVFNAQPLDESMLATTREIRDLIDEPREDLTIIDTRTETEYLEEGTIPGSVLVDYIENNFADGTYKPVTQIRIQYIKAGVDVDEGAVLFCKTSVRGAQTYLAMYNAGYRNLKLYDGAWVEWTANPMNPIYRDEPESVQLNAADNS